MRWPWSKPETRDSGGDFSDAVVRLIEAQAAGHGCGRKLEHGGRGSRLRVRSEPCVRLREGGRVRLTSDEAVTGRFLAQVGRDLIRSGDSMHVIAVMGGVKLIPCSSWHWEGSHDPDSWTVRATAYGPSTSTTWNLPAAGVVFLTWGSTPGQTYVGTGPLSWAHTTARLQSEAERSLADEAGRADRAICSRSRMTGATLATTTRSRC